MVRDIIVHRGDHQRRSSMVPCAMDRLRREFQQLGILQGPDACRKAARISTRIQDAIPDPQIQDFPRLFHLLRMIDWHCQ